MEQDVILSIRSKLDIVDVISEYIPLTKQGKNFFCVCPFHDDNHPSMSVSREKQIYKCFSCGASGTVFTFVQEYEHLSFKDTLKLLADKAGVQLSGKYDHKEISKYDKYYKMYDLANRFYQNNLQASIGKKAKEYLSTRSLNEEVIKEFGIGLSLGGSNQLTTLLQKQDYQESELNQYGLSNNNHDVYQDRIMFPLFDSSGKCVGFSGRRYLNEEGSKYINTKETNIFIKGNNLYHYHSARSEVRVKKNVLVMEGFMDVIRAFTVDVKNVVALMGTAMTKEQVSLLGRLSKDVILCFDGDEAGRHATLVNGEVLVNNNFNVKVILLPSEEDPDTYILKRGKTSFLNLIDSACFYQDFKIKHLKEGRNLNSDKEKSEYVHAVLEETSKINDEIEREIILKKLAIEFNLSYNTLEKGLNELISAKISDKKVEIVQKPLRKVNDKYYVAPRAILYYMMTNHQVLNYYIDNGIFFPLEVFRVFASEIVYIIRKHGKIELADYYIYLSDKKDLLEILKSIVDLDLKDEVGLDAIKDYISVMEKDYKRQEIKKLKALIRSTPDINEKVRLSEKVRVLRMGVE